MAVDYYMHSTLSAAGWRRGGGEEGKEGQTESGRTGRGGGRREGGREGSREGGREGGRDTVVKSPLYIPLYVAPCFLMRSEGMTGRLVKSSLRASSSTEG